MITIKCGIKCTDNDEIFNKILSNYTYAYHEVFNGIRKGVVYDEKTNVIDSPSNKILNKYNLKVNEFHSLLINCKERIEQCNTYYENLVKEKNKINEKLVDLIKNGKENLSNKQLCYYNRLVKKDNICEKRVNKCEHDKYGIVFGGKMILRQITFLSNCLNKSDDELKRIAIKRRNRNQRNSNHNKEESLKQLKEDIEKLPELKKQWNENRLIPYYSIGDALCKGNRQFNFDFNSKTVSLKTYLGKIEINFTSKRSEQLFKKLQEACDNKKLPVTVTLGRNFICFTYDEGILYGTSIKVGMKTEKCALPDTKVYAGIDWNPTEIGLQIIKNNEDGTFKKHYGCNFVLKKLPDNKGLKSTDKKYSYAQNYLKNQIGEITKQIFKICKHYNVSYFVVENLENLNKKGDKNLNKRVNKLLNQKGHINKWMQLFEKHCKMGGVNFSVIYPAYSSLIGNLRNNSYDSVNAATYIAQSGIISKYNKENKLKLPYRSNKPSVSDIKKYKKVLKRNNTKNPEETQCDVQFTEWKQFKTDPCRKKNVGSSGVVKMPHKSKTRIEIFKDGGLRRTYSPDFYNTIRRDNSQI